jgi:hypothetical protein
MNASIRIAVRLHLAQLLALLSVATFWLVPLSPFVALAAVCATKSSNEWSNLVARTGAILCVVWTVVLAVVLLWLVSLSLLHSSWAF